MREFLVAVWWSEDGSAPWLKNYFDFDTADEAVLFANEKASALRSKGFEFCVQIYRQAD